MVTYNIVTELRCRRVKGYKELTKNLGKLRFFVQKVKEDLKNGKKTREKHMFCEDFGSRRNGSLGEAVIGIPTLFGRGSFVGVLRGHPAKATKGASDCLGEI